MMEVLTMMKTSFLRIAVNSARVSRWVTWMMRGRRES